MYYWNKTNFEGLEAIGRLMAQEPELQLYAQYCEWRVKGVRKKALQAITGFANSAAKWDFEKRRGFTDWLLTLQNSSAEVHQLIPFQVSNQIIEPTLKEWVKTIPDSVAALRWYGIAFRDYEALEKATSLDPAEIVARRTLLDWYYDELWFSTHHLPDYFIGEPEALKVII